jgi:hypothetical protein
LNSALQWILDVRESRHAILRGIRRVEVFVGRQEIIEKSQD